MVGHSAFEGFDDRTFKTAQPEEGCKGMLQGYGYRAQRLRTLRKAAEPWEMMQSRSISPKRRPPSRARPSTGCLVRICTGPRPRECILSSTCSKAGSQ